MSVPSIEVLVIPDPADQQSLGLPWGTWYINHDRAQEAWTMRLLWCGIVATTVAALLAFISPLFLVLAVPLQVLLVILLLMLRRQAKTLARLKQEGKAVPPLMSEELKRAWLIIGGQMPFNATKPRCPDDRLELMREMDPWIVQGCISGGYDWQGLTDEVRRASHITSARWDLRGVSVMEQAFDEIFTPAWRQWD